MPSAALTEWQTIRMLRLAQIDGQCASIVGLVPPNPDLLDESLRGYVMLLSAHFQGFCRTLYSECSQICAAAVSADFKATIQAQFTAALQLGKQNPSLKTVQADFERFGFKLKFPAIHASQITDLDQGSLSIVARSARKAQRSTGFAFARGQNRPTSRYLRTRSILLLRQSNRLAG